MIDVIATRPHYVDHLLPVWDALPPEERGRFWDEKPNAGGETALVASRQDHLFARRAGYRRIVVMEHGIGQSYSNREPSYAGGDGREADLFLVPNHVAAQRWAEAYPEARVEAVGSPRLDTLPDKLPGPLTVAISFHWECRIAPETRPALEHYRAAIPALRDRFHLIGHSHPRSPRRAFFERQRIPYVETFDEVCRRADLYITDNSSTLFEFAATGRPVVVLNAPWYRRHVNHGLRFWEAAGVGINVHYPHQLVWAVEEALEDDELYRDAREAALGIVYAHRTGAARRAADAMAAVAA